MPQSQITGPLLVPGDVLLVVPDMLDAEVNLGAAEEVVYLGQDFVR